MLVVSVILIVSWPPMCGENIIAKSIERLHQGREEIELIWEFLTADSVSMSITSLPVKWG